MIILLDTNSYLKLHNCLQKKDSTLDNPTMVDIPLKQPDQTEF